jgi:hypothetical protein
MLISTGSTAELVAVGGKETLAVRAPLCAWWDRRKLAVVDSIVAHSETGSCKVT